MINLLAPEIKQQVRAARFNVILLNYCIILGIGIAIALIIFAYGFFVSMQERSLAEADRSQAETNAAQYASTRKLANDFTKDLKQAKIILGSGVSLYDLVTKIANIVPPGVILSNLSLSTNSLNTPLVINARAQNYQQAISLKNKLSESSIFDNVSITNTSSTIVTPQSDPIGAKYPIVITASAQFSAEYMKGQGAKR